MIWVAASLVTLAAWFGALLTWVTLPGMWVALAAAAACWAWQPELFSWPTFAGAAALAVLGEVVEFFASAAGAGRAGGTRAGALGSLVGSVAGMVAGAIFLPFLPIIGAILTGIVGAGVGAALAERRWAKRTWDESLRSARGAATGRALSIVAKGAVAIALAAELTLAAWIN